MGAEISKCELTPEEEAACWKKGRDKHNAAVAAYEQQLRDEKNGIQRSDSVVTTAVPALQEEERSQPLLDATDELHQQQQRQQSAAERAEVERLAVEEQAKLKAREQYEQQRLLQEQRDKAKLEKYRLEKEDARKRRIERESAEKVRQEYIAAQHEEAKRRQKVYQDQQDACRRAVEAKQAKILQQAKADAAHKAKLAREAVWEAQAVEKRGAKSRLEKEQREKEQREKEQQEKEQREKEKQDSTKEAKLKDINQATKDGISTSGRQQQDSSKQSNNTRPQNVRPPSSPQQRRQPQSSVSAGKRPLSDEAQPLPRIPKRPRTTTTASSSMSPASPVTSAEERQPPNWYLALKNERNRNADKGQTTAMMQSIKTQINKCISTGRMEVSGMNIIRDKLHALVFEKVSGKLLRNNMMLHNEDGLPQLFDSRYSEGIDYPSDIRADAEELYNKWCNQDFETDLLRGILAKGGAGAENRSADGIDPDWPRINARYHGNGKLLNGQWFPSNIATYRDGAHGAPQAGICGSKGQGAFSCILSDGYDDDEDHGDWILYCGTDQKTFVPKRLPDGTVDPDSQPEPTDNTKLMIESVSSSHPVRVLRSHNCRSQWAPIIGFRYDGLYDVVSVEKLDPPDVLRQRHRFKLVRREGQDPIRGGKGPEMRPTLQEIEQYEKDRRFRGIGGGAVKGKKKGTGFPTWG
jgi:hypothetical protein